jgi:hypothetical protein
MSKTRTMKPTIPPPVPYCVALELRVVKSSAIGAAEQRAARQRWRKRENMIACVELLCRDCGFEDVGCSSVAVVCCSR